ncbi:MAG: MFS transporter [Planctomycetes bacterium]|nr:MFS transporter [Planctomycetota bacterium]
MDELRVIQKKGQRVIIFTQCFGLLPYLCYYNGFMLAYMSKLGLAGDQVLLLLGIPTTIAAICSIPLAYLGDYLGIKQMGVIGIVGSILSFFLFWLCSFLPQSITFWGLFFTLCLHGLSMASTGSGWFALLRPLIAKEERGWFFAKLRVSWQVVGVIVGFAITALLKRGNSINTYQAVVLGLFFALIIHLLLYKKIPDITEKQTKKEPILKVLSWLISLPEYLAFGVYLLFIALCTGSFPWLIGLLEKEHLGFSDSNLISMGICMSMGSIAGFYFGGRLVDRFGCKPVLILAHLSYAIILTLVILRAFLPFDSIYNFGLINAAWGLVAAAAGIALTSETMVLAPIKNQALAISLLGTFSQIGIALSALFSAKLVSIGVFADQWSLFGCDLYNYDALFFLITLATILFLVTLGLVPSVLPKASHLPGQPGSH